MYAPTSPSPTKGMSSLFQCFPLVSEISEGQSLLIRLRWRWHSLLHVPCQQGHFPIQQHVHTFPTLPFATCVLKNFILFLLTSFLRFNYKWALPFIDISLHARQCLSIPLRLPIPAFTFCKLPLYVWILSGAPFSFMNEICMETYYTVSFSKNKKCISGFT